MRTESGRRWGAFIARTLMVPVVAALMACGVPVPEGSENFTPSDLDLQIDEVRAGGRAAERFHECSTATVTQGFRWRYRTSIFNNTSRRIRVEVTMDDQFVAALYPVKAGTDTFVEPRFGFRLQLVNKRDGTKSVRIFHRDRLASEDNGWCRAYDMSSAPVREDRARCGPALFSTLKDCLPFVVAAVGVKACELCAAGAIPALASGVGATPAILTCLTCVGTIGVCGYHVSRSIEACL
jgi:hypothetical protein